LALANINSFKHCSITWWEKPKKGLVKQNSEPHADYMHKRKEKECKKSQVNDGDAPNSDERLSP
jgi:hypothetical protein